MTLEEAQSIANDLNVTPEQVLILCLHTAPALYLEDNRYDPARLVENEDWEENTSALHDAMDQLDDRSRNILHG